MKQARQSSALTPQERSAIAVREFRKMLPGLTAFTRALTKNPRMKVVMGAMSATDGKVITIRPPMALAYSKEHQRAYCDKREGGSLICPACARMEEIYTVIYHEISHNVAGSLEPVSITRMNMTVREAASQHGSPEFQRYMHDQIDKLGLNSSGEKHVYQYALEISEYLISFVRALDDFRIDRAAGIARPGVEIMRYHQTEAILNTGIENDLGEFMHWSERHVEAQIPIAILVGKQGHVIEGRFDDRIPQLFRVPIFEELLNRSVKDVLDVLHVSVSFLAELNKLGLYDLPLPEPLPLPPPEEPEDSGEESDSNGNESGESAGKGSGAGGSGKESEDAEDNDTEPGEDTSQQGEKDGQDAGNGSGAGSGDNSDSSPADSERSGNNSSGSDSSSNDKSIATATPGNEQGGRENDDRPDDPRRGDGENSEKSESVDGGENDTDAGDSVSGENGGDEDSETDSSGGNSPDDGNFGDDGDPSESDGGSAEQNDSVPEGPDGGDSRPEDSGNKDGEEKSEGNGGSSAAIVGSTDQAPDFSNVGHASSEEIEDAIEQASGHAEAEVILGGRGEPLRDGEGDSYMEQAIVKALVFDDATTTVTGLQVFRSTLGGDDWENYSTSHRLLFRPLEQIELSPSILHARRAFSDSKLDRNVRNLKKGKVARAKLGARAWNPKEDRLFQRKIRAEGIDDELVIGMDLSGSTARHWNETIKQTAHAMGDVLHSVGVKFSIYGHTTDDAWSTQDFCQYIYEVKRTGDPWGPQQKSALAGLPALNGSLDGHNLEFYRKILMQSQARRKTLVYYTDGQIPETNHDEEAMIIERELRLYKQLGFNILCIAFGTDGPKEYGLDTIKISGAKDIATVIRELEKRLTS